ncbi:AMP-binding protein [Solirubrobacter ginsenosidimutans]|uniref:AMP-binding protein n=1 Tax=Solirubrobacter ginsenosidimutans TaxID=490573 RepID=A0A9X3S0R4_9ACTN|nr:AMP-binding protein [Solirubrobacter ginsenosidimutans]MDA0160352.1 AMP-binding protein [Solirubrobacter ginsenosidimutans]
MTARTSERRAGFEVRRGIQEFLPLSARRSPDSVCMELPDGTRFTFEATNARVNRLANALAEDGIGHGSRVALMGVDSHRYFEACMAIMKLSATMVPLNFRLRRREVDTLLAKAEPAVLLHSDRYTELLEGIAESQPTLRQVICFEDGYEDVLTRGAETEPSNPRPDENDIAALAFTSGTTGLPKGVQQSFGMLTRLVSNNCIDYGPRSDDFWYCASPLFHVAGLAFPMMGIALGYRSLILPQFGAETVLRHIDREDGLTAVFLVPTMIASVLGVPGAREADWSRLRLISYGSAPMSPALLTDVMNLAGCDFLNCFGAGTEAGSQTTLGPGEHRRALAGATHLLGSIGKPAFGVELRLCDFDGNDVPRGEVGEIVTRSTTVMNGYLDMPEETDRVFIGDGWFRGGDLAYMDDEGYLFLKGRSKDMIIRGGENIYPVEIEHVLAEDPRIEYSAVVGVEDEHWGQTVRAWVLPVAGATITADELTELCTRNLAKYKVPDEFVFVDDLPRNASGKVLKRTLVTWEPAEHAR